MLKKEFRLGKQDIERIYKKGTRHFQPPFLVRLLANRFNFNRYGVVIPKAVIAKATARNYLRRKIYILLKEQNTPGSRDYLITLKEKTAFEDMAKTLKLFFIKVK